VTPAYQVEAYLGVLLVIVIMFQTMSRALENLQRRRGILAPVEERRVELLAKKRQAMGGAASPSGAVN
jgi:ribose transport system permease protein